MVNQFLWVLWRNLLGLVREPFAFKIQIFQTIVILIFRIYIEIGTEIIIFLVYLQKNRLLR
jgi:hypothetical protein